MGDRPQGRGVHLWAWPVLPRPPALGLGAGLFGVALGAVGYHPNVPQTAATLAGMRAIIVIIPGVGLIGSALVMFAYPMGRGGHEQIVEDLARRGAAGLEPAELSVE